ncbi:MAG: hypothetical protein D6729_03425 [Deltaproteobacteria bacterium]|nr:MAG: hypothetical protein D6729_03425 [Deltaproteobacteria bacterium]
MKPWVVGVLFLVTFAALLGLIAFVLVTGRLGTMMALSAIAYALAAMGFLCVVGWAFVRGQFTDYEEIKEDLFEIEARR